MTPADLARKHSISLEAKKDRMAQRQSNDWAVTFTVQGTDMDARLTQAPMGTRYAMVLVEIGDDELPVQKENAAKPRQTSSPNPTGGAKQKMDWRDMPPASQAFLRCRDATFQAYLREVEHYEVRGEESAAAAVRDYCGVESRKDLSILHPARVIWHQLDKAYSAWLAKERVGA
jgi:hypothetical protein